MGWFDDFFNGLSMSQGNPLPPVGDAKAPDYFSSQLVDDGGIVQSVRDAADYTANEAGGLYDWGKAQAQGLVNTTLAPFEAASDAASNAITGLGQSIAGTGAVLLVGGIILAMMLWKHRAGVAHHAAKFTGTAARAAAVAA